MRGTRNAMVLAAASVVLASAVAASAQVLFIEDFENITGPGGPSVDTARFGPVLTETGLVLSHGSIDRTAGTSMFSNAPDRNGDGFVNSADDAAFNSIILSSGEVPLGQPQPGATYPGILPLDRVNFDSPPSVPLSLISSGRIRIEMPCPVSAVNLNVVAPSMLLYLITAGAVQSAGGSSQPGPLGGFPVAGPFGGELSDPRGDFDQDGIGDSTGFAVVPGTGLIIASNDATGTGFLADEGVGVADIGRQLGRADLGLAPSTGPDDPTHVAFSRTVFGLTPLSPADPTVADLVITFFLRDAIVGTTVADFVVPDSITTTGLLEQTVQSNTVVPERLLITAVEIVSRNGALGPSDATWNGRPADGFIFAVDDVFVVADLPGDFDRDGDSDLADFMRLEAMFAEIRRPNAQCPRCDLDGDNDVDLADLVAFQAGFTGSCNFP